MSGGSPGPCWSAPRRRTRWSGWPPATPAGRSPRSTAPPAAVAAAQVVALVGMPECRLALAQVTVHLATAPKSNAVITAIDEAMSQVRGGAVGSVPAHLRDGHYAGAQKLGNAVGYRYPHDVP